VRISNTFVSKIKAKTNTNGEITISRLLPNVFNLGLPAGASSFITSAHIKVTTPAIPSEAIRLTAELLVMVLTVVVTVEIILYQLLPEMYHS
jgi:hypothetical protein